MAEITKISFLFVLCWRSSPSPSALWPKLLSQWILFIVSWGHKILSPSGKYLFLIDSFICEYIWYGINLFLIWCIFLVAVYCWVWNMFKTCCWVYIGGIAWEISPQCSEVYKPCGVDPESALHHLSSVYSCELCLCSIEILCLWLFRYLHSLFHRCNYSFYKGNETLEIFRLC